MGGKRKTKRVKKNAGDNLREGQNSSSTSSPTIRQNEKTKNQVQVKVAAKNTNKNKEHPSNLVDKSQEQEPSSTTSMFQETSIYDLPTEMLTKILENVDTQALFKCRLMSRQWSGISTRILTTRNSPQLGFFHSYTGKITCEGTQWKNSEKNLQDFVSLIKTSGNCPYAHFSFRSINNSFFDDKGWISFLSFFNTANENPNLKKNKLKGLKLHLRTFYDEKTLVLFEEKLRDLFQNKMAHLEQLDLDVNGRITSFSSPVSTPIPTPFQLSNLKVLRIEQNLFFNFRGLVQDIIKSAVNLEKIDARSIDQDFVIKIIPFLHSMEKLHLLQSADIVIDQNSLSAMKTSVKKTNRPLLFKLTRLNLESTKFPAQIQSLPTFCRDASQFLSDLFESSKNSLKELKMSPLGFLEELRVPKFKNLTTLRFLWQKNHSYYGAPFPVPFPHAYFPPGTGSGSSQIFPAVTTFNCWTMNWRTAFPQEEEEDRAPTFIFSRVTRLFLCDSDLMGNGNENVVLLISRMFPNLEQCFIKYDCENFNFSRVGRQIWTHLTKLKTLRFAIDPKSQHYDFPQMDSCLTGISIENCRRLQDLMKAGKIQRNAIDRTLQFQIPEAEMIKLTHREHPSILNLKELENLTINQHESRGLQMAESVFETQKMSWISQEFAFKFLPHLKQKPEDQKESVPILMPYSLRSRKAKSNSTDLNVNK